MFDKPVPFWLIDIPSDNHPRTPPKMDWNQCDNSLRWCRFRSIEANKLLSVLRNGVDVDPTNGVIYVGPFDKSWEYGDFPKVTLALDFNKLRKTFCEISAALPPNEIETLRKRFPTC
jgi:hypothetical protein